MINFRLLSGIPSPLIVVSYSIRFFIYIFLLINCAFYSLFIDETSDTHTHKKETLKQGQLATLPSLVHPLKSQIHCLKLCPIWHLPLSWHDQTNYYCCILTRYKKHFINDTSLQHMRDIWERYLGGAKVFRVDNSSIRLGVFWKRERVACRRKGPSGEETSSSHLWSSIGASSPITNLASAFLLCLLIYLFIYLFGGEDKCLIAHSPKIIFHVSLS